MALIQKQVDAKINEVKKRIKFELSLYFSTQFFLFRWLCLEKKEDMTQSYDKIPYTKIMSKKKGKVATQKRHQKARLHSDCGNIYRKFYTMIFEISIHFSCCL